MRNLSAEALTKITQQYGAEPINIISIEWVLGQKPLFYADRDVAQDGTFIPGAIQQLNNIDNVIDVSNNDTSSEVEIVMSDHDGSIKNLFDTNDIHQRNVVIYQWFDGIDLDDKFVLFQGKISSPIVWDEGKRTLALTVLSQIEEGEFGFSPEEGQFDFISDDLVGKPWPSVFGTYVHTPAVRLDGETVGTLADGFGVADFTLPNTALAHQLIADEYQRVALLWALASAGYAERGMEQEAQQALSAANQNFAASGQERQKGFDVGATFSAQKATERSKLRVIGGDRFPQGVTLTLLMGNILVQGWFGGEIFNVNYVAHPQIWNFAPGGVLATNFFPLQQFRHVLPPDTGTEMKLLPVAEKTIVRVGGRAVGALLSGNIVGEQAGFAKADPGAQVTIASLSPLSFVASITPGNVISVHAWAEFNGTRHLLEVPANYYTVSTLDLGDIAATIVTLNDSLTKRVGEGWAGDELYVTFKSTIGPNTVDVIEYIIDTYTEFSVDAASFADVKAKIANYPSHFAVLDRPQVMDLLQDIAFQARCALYLKGEKLFIVYLPETPASVATINESLIDVESMKVLLTDTEGISTKIVAKWKTSGAQDEHNRTILRHNVKKYGTKEREFNVFIYNNRELVYKSMVYWLIRFSKTWKRLEFTSPLDLLNLEAFDGVTLDFAQDFVACETVIGRIEEANYDSQSQQMRFSVWVPVLAGTCTEYVFAYPKDVSVQLVFPTPEERAGGFAGGVSPGQDAKASVGSPGGALSVTYNGDENPYNHGNNIHTDEGANPTDQGDTNPGEPNNTPVAGVGVPVVSVASPQIVTSKVEQEQIFVIDLHETRIFDSKNDRSAPLSSFFLDVNDDKLRMSTDAELVEAGAGAGGKTGQFDFKFDAAGGKFGAGTAFLKEGST